MQTRMVSYLLHPPLLDEAGFGAAASWYVDGFAKRSGTKVNLDLPPQLGRLNHDIEIALFRTLQETLTNDNLLQTIFRNPMGPYTDSLAITGLYCHADPSVKGILSAIADYNRHRDALSFSAIF